MLYALANGPPATKPTEVRGICTYIHMFRLFPCRSSTSNELVKLAGLWDDCFQSFFRCLLMS